MMPGMTFETLHVERVVIMKPRVNSFEVGSHFLRQWARYVYLSIVQELLAITLYLHYERIANKQSFGGKTGNFQYQNL